jgi:hypothetical protein
MADSGRRILLPQSVCHLVTYRKLTIRLCTQRQLNAKRYTPVKNTTASKNTLCQTADRPVCKHLLTLRQSIAHNTTQYNNNVSGFNAESTGSPPRTSSRASFIFLLVTVHSVFQAGIYQEVSPPKICMPTICVTY